jgi:hypothetical protein
VNEKLWAGVEIKLQHAEFHLEKMSRSLEPPERTQLNVALQASGAILDTGWQRTFYAHLDAFLSAARSVPEIIQCCFGEDQANREMKDWFGKLSGSERTRRQEFRKQFEPHHDAFRSSQLSIVRNVSEHRTGIPPTTTISGLFGVTYIGNAIERVPISETRPIDDPTFAFLARPNPIQPKWADFDIGGQPLFPACRQYLDAARATLVEARRIAVVVHGSNNVSSPPT